MAEVKLPFKVKAKYGWSGQTKGDLGFLEGDIMEVSRVTGDWYYGKLLRNSKCAGYFPHNFVVIIEPKQSFEQSQSQSPSRSVTAHNQAQPSSLSPKRVSVPNIPSRSSQSPTHNYNSDSHAKLRRTTRDLKPSTSNPYNQVSPIATSISTASPRSSSSGYSYNSPNSSSPSSPINPKRGANSKSHRFYEQHNHQSSPDLGSSSRRRPTSPSKMVAPHITQQPLPPLPPLPTVSSKRISNLIGRGGPVKSYSSNDIALSRAEKARGGAYRDYNDDFNDMNRPLDGSSRHPYLHDASSSNSFSNSRYLDSSTTDSENSFALMSDFSATSAGSFARHKYAQSFSDSLQRSQTAPLSSSNDIDLLQNSVSGSGSNTSSGNNKQSLTNSNNGQMGNLLRKILPRSATLASNHNNSLPKLPSLQDLTISSGDGGAADGSNPEADHWITVKSQVNRSRTLTKYEKHPRYMRALEEVRDLVLHPQDSIYNGLNTNETKMNAAPGNVDIAMTELNFDYIDQMTRKRCDKNNNMKLDTWAASTFSARYGTTLEKLRGMYVFCTEMFDLVDDNGSSDFSAEPVELGHILHKRYCTPYQLTWLFKRLANSLGITCEIVIGFLKTPGAENSEFKYNHCWLRVLVNREWRFIDVILGNTTNPIHEFVDNHKSKRADDSYFLVEPLKFIYTHVPPRDFEQHIVPSIDQLSALYLPLVFPSFFDNELKLHNFSTALSYLEDSEIYECSLEIPNDIEVFASVVATPDNGDPESSKKFSEMNLALTQIKKHKPDSGRRIAFIKAVLPPGASTGQLYIHSGMRGKQTSIANVHPLSLLIPLKHKGNEMKFEFVVRVPSENVQNVETYIKEPQNRYLFVNNEYTFDIIQNPYDGIIYNDNGDVVEDNAARNKMQPMAIQSPSGKIYELKKQYPNMTYGLWSTSLKLKEEGMWSALIRADSGLGWCVCAEWLCIA
ncbi:Cyk3 protein [Maudiozyma humilis]|uniref:Cyk3 protein n=1 Tax=Maudiozyma humilis TaxID=51915 RepID=A0AAV5RQJ8_MAUHU|nr:Cyk3 protein [Kazachstania humilis]